jgi:hypothetical protein
MAKSGILLHMGEEDNDFAISMTYLATSMGSGKLESLLPPEEFRQSGSSAKPDFHRYSPWRA